MQLVRHSTVRRSTVLIATALVAALGGTALQAAHADSAPPRTSRVSTATGGLEADGASSAPAISADGRYVAFVSAADNLVRGDTNGVADVFVRDLRTGRTQRVAEGPAEDPALSADGRYVVFSTRAALAKGDDNGLDDIYLVDRRTHRTERISTGHATEPPSYKLNYEPTISANGRYVAYSTATADAAPGDTNGRDDVIVHDRRTGGNELVQYRTDGTLGDSASFLASFSANGRYVAFTTAAQLDPAHEWTHGTNVYVRDRAKGTTEQVSIPTRFVYKNGSWGPSISADARYVAFSSNVNNLVPDDTNKTTDAFVFDRKLKTTQRLSTAADGSQSDGPSEGVSLSPDGRRVAFVSSADNLVPGDTNGVADIFVKDLRTDAVQRVSLAADGSQADGPSDAVSLSTGGHAAFSSTATNLVPGDGNGVADVFVRHLR
ncbi:TolB family protein [Streptomyces sp. NPDC001401]|uniref:TolB family protein n=1 Tax=Streptomyces sp. NPDC001401 TaxID=3364570 RepID=UPI0036907D51